jgi:phosphotransferase system enzyme I (PtsI)
MEIKRGIPVSPGIAIGPALVLDTEWFRIPRRTLGTDALDAEVNRLHEALVAAARESREKEALVAGKLGPEYGAI